MSEAGSRLLGLNLGLGLRGRLNLLNRGGLLNLLNRLGGRSYFCRYGNLEAR